MIKQKIIYRDIIRQVEQEHIQDKKIKVDVGDTVKIQKVIQEGNKERIQISDGVVICKKNNNLNRSITIRKIIQNIGVERIYIINSPQIVNIKILRKAKIRRSKLYYLRTRSGKATRLKQKLK